MPSTFIFTTFSYILPAFNNHLHILLKEIVTISALAFLIPKRTEKGNTGESEKEGERNNRRKDLKGMKGKKNKEGRRLISVG